MKTFPLEMVTRDSHYPSRDVAELRVPAHGGGLTVLAGHQPMICELVAGRIVVIDGNGQRETWHSGAGHMTVNREGVTVLVASLERRSEGPRLPGYGLLNDQR